MNKQSRVNIYNAIKKIDKSGARVKLTLEFFSLQFNHVY